MTKKNISTWTIDAWFYDGDISCDAILGYSWLAQKRLNVQPWRDALQLHDPPHWTLLSKPMLPKKSPNSAEISVMTETPRPMSPKDTEAHVIDSTPQLSENNSNGTPTGHTENFQPSGEELLDRDAKINRIRMMQLELTEEVNEEGEV